MSKTYGIISDMHSIDPMAIGFAMDKLKQEGCEAFLIAGDIAGERTGERMVDYLMKVLTQAAYRGVEVSVIPGSHECVQEFESVLRFICERHPNIINALETSWIDCKDHELLFIGGSDLHAGRANRCGYFLDNENGSGYYKNDDGICRLINVDELKMRVKNPDKTILVSHVPGRFCDSEHGIDAAHFGRAEETFMLGDDKVERGSVIPADFANQLIETGAPMTIHVENRGYEPLTRFLKETGIRKTVSAHFHESAGRATDLEGKPVEEGLFVDELVYNAGCMDRGMAGMLTVDSGKAAYENIDLRKYQAAQ